MTIHELTREQLQQVKQQYLVQQGKSLSYGELIDIDNLVSDEEIFEAEAGTNFVEDDFVISDTRSQVGRAHSKKQARRKPPCLIFY